MIARKGRLWTRNRVEAPQGRKLYYGLKRRNGLQTKHEEETVIISKKKKAFVKRISVH
jgi:hypothetical protein